MACASDICTAAGHTWIRRHRDAYHQGMSVQKQKKPFSMIREFHLADWFTLGNAVCGTAAIFSTISYVQTGDVRHVYFACALVLAALLFDIVDGRVARWREKSSEMGRELDSLADVDSQLRSSLPQ